SMNRAVEPMKKSVTEQATAPAPLPPLTPPAPAAAADGITLTDSPATLKVVVGDARGNVTFGSTVTSPILDQSGRAVSTAAGAGIPGVEARPGQKIVLNADYTLDVSDASQTMGHLQQMATAAGGYVVEATLAKGNDASYLGRLVLRVPSGAYTGAVDQVRQSGKVTQERQWTQDVSDRYSDLQARIALLQEMQGKLEELSLKAATFNDWLQLAKQLNETRAQIEQMQGNLKQLDNQVDYSTLTIALHQQAPGTVEQLAAPAAQGLGRQLGQTFTHSVGTLGHLGTVALIGLVAAVPFAVPLLLALVGLLWLWRRKRKE
ncbi:MAG: DUF4349 domain-containing protein, partial [Mycobacterium leprae]